MKKIVWTALGFFVILGVTSCMGPQVINATTYTRVSYDADDFTIEVSIETSETVVSDSFVKRIVKGSPLRLFIIAHNSSGNILSVEVQEFSIFKISENGSLSLVHDQPNIEDYLIDFSGNNGSYFSNGYDLDQLKIERYAIDAKVGICFANIECQVVEVSGNFDYSTSTSIGLSILDALSSI